MKIGFTGTREGMSKRQEGLFSRVISEYFYDMDEFHHGDCIGADAEAHQHIHDCRRYDEDGHEVKIVIHPPLKDEVRAHCKTYNRDPYYYDDIIKVKKNYLERNRDIVDATDLLIATPKELSTTEFYGTMYTIKYAHDKGVPVIILW